MQSLVTEQQETLSQAPVSKPERLMSLDVFRGATIASMILVNNPGSWDAVYTPLEHADWHGWTFTDLVFPFFLWIVGVAITLSMARRVAEGADKSRLLLHIVRRAVLIFLVGELLSLVPYFRFSTVRIPGVLQRIAICYLIAATIFLFTNLRGRVLWIAGLLAAWWMLVMFVAAPGSTPGFLDRPEGTLQQYWDGLFLSGHMYSQTKTWDPEGILSTLPAIATVLFGILAGMLLQAKKTMEEKTAWMFLLGNLLIFAGLILSTWVPINKKLWTSSYAVFMAGMAWVVFAGCYWLIDVQKWRRFAKPFAIYGMNAITVYVLSGVIAKALGLIQVTAPDGKAIPLETFLYRNFFQPVASPKNASLLYALTNVAVLYGVAWFMYRRKWIVRL